MNDETQGPDERKPFLHFGEILARSGVRSNDVEEPDGNDVEEVEVVERIGDEIGKNIEDAFYSLSAVLPLMAEKRKALVRKNGALNGTDEE